jgi:hypothetical protein
LCKGKLILSHQLALELAGMLWTINKGMELEGVPWVLDLNLKSVGSLLRALQLICNWICFLCPSFLSLPLLFQMALFKWAML